MASMRPSRQVNAITVPCPWSAPLTILLFRDTRPIGGFVLSIFAAGMIFTLSGGNLNLTAALLQNGSVHTFGTLSVFPAKAISSAGEFGRNAVQE